MSNGTVLAKKDAKFLYLFILFWLIFGFATNFFIDVNGEEAYYWLFGQYPSWGYLDHPPMIGWLTALGYQIIPNAMGLRFFMPILSVGMVLLIWEITDRQNTWLLIWMSLGLGVLHAASYLVKTDVPLLFFVLLFFYGYKNFLKEDNWKAIIILIVSIAGIMLSKYHGFLVVVLVVFSNLTLLKQKSFWIVVGGVTILMLPHLFWQIEHEFITFKFHLFSRKDLGFKWESVVYFFVVQPFFFGPLTGVVLFYVFLKEKTNDKFERALKFAGYGVFLFFLFLSFRVEFHKHWTSVLGVPLVLYGFKYINGDPKLTRITVSLSKISFVFLVLAKIYWAYDFLPSSLTKGWDKIHGWDSWAEEVKELSNGLPVVFESNYERASRYYYLTGEKTHSYNAASYRETEHDLLPFESDLIGKDVFWINRSDDPSKYTQHMTAFGKEVQYRIVENFQSFRKVRITLLEESTSSSKLQGKLELKNGSDHTIDFDLDDGRGVSLMIHFLKEKAEKGTEALRPMNGRIASGEVVVVPFEVLLPSEFDEIDLRFSLKIDDLLAPINSLKYNIEYN